MEQRLPAHLEVSGLIRAVQAEGGFATVIGKGERDAGTLLVVCFEPGARSRAYERMPQADGSRQWSLTKSESPDDPTNFAEYLDRRRRQDRDLWIVELDIANPERFIGLAGTIR